MFDKALDEPNYSSMYAQLCLRLNDFVQSEDQLAGVSVCVCERGKEGGREGGRKEDWEGGREEDWEGGRE